MYIGNAQNELKLINVSANIDYFFIALVCFLFYFFFNFKIFIFEED